MLNKQHVTNHLPVKEPSTFNRNVFYYSAFITASYSIICDNVSTDKDRLYFLNKYTVGHIRTKEVMNPREVLRMSELNFSEWERDQAAPSKEDRRFIAIVKDGIAYRNGQYEIPLPMKDGTSNLPNNRMMAANRLKPLKKRLKSNPKYREDYVTFMNKVISNGYAEKVRNDEQHVKNGKPV